MSYSFTDYSLRNREHEARKSADRKGCGCYIIILIFNLLVGGWCTAQILTWFGKDIPFFWDVVIGAFTAEITFPVAVVGWILRMLGVFN